MNRKMKNILYGVNLAFICFSVYGQETNPRIVKNDYVNQKKWVDSIYEQMTVDEKFGQLFMVDLFFSDTQSKIDRIKDLIQHYHMGGVIFSKGGPVRQAKINNEFQELSKIPLLIGMDRSEERRVG